MEKIKSLFKHNYVKLFLLAAALAISFKPLLFTWNFLNANFWLKTDKTKAGAYMAGAVSAKSSVYKVFNRHAPMVLEQYLVKTAIIKNNTELLKSYSAVIPFSRIREQFKDNFYIAYILGKTGEKEVKGDWQNLDDVSFDLLSDSKWNQQTTTALDNIRSVLDRSFLTNLADFALWQDNRPLYKYLAKYLAASGRLIPPDQPPFISAKSEGYDYEQSVARLKQLLWKKYKLKGEWLGENLLLCPGFSEPDRTAANWYFSNMAGEKGFSRGSFFMGGDKVGINQNPVIRIMGFFTADDPGKSKPRAGLRGRQIITAENGFYIFSFDYCTVTGKERASFWLGKKIEKRLLHTRRQWRKAIFIINNAFNQYETLNPVIRLWGTGTLLVDNVFLAKTHPLKFSIDTPYEFHVAKFKQE